MKNIEQKIVLSCTKSMLIAFLAVLLFHLLTGSDNDPSSIIIVFWIPVIFAANGANNTDLSSEEYDDKTISSLKKKIATYFGFSYLALLIFVIIYLSLIK